MNGEKNTENQEVKKHYLYNCKREKALRKNPTQRYKYYIYSFHDKGKTKQKQTLVTDAKINNGYNEEYLKPCNGTLPSNMEDLMNYIPPNKLKKISYIKTHPWKFNQPPTNQEALKIIKQYMTRDSAVKYNIDQDLMLCFLTDFFILPPRKTELMKYAPHKVIYTNPKTGKSSVANRMGKQVTHPSIARILGFSTADSVVQGAVDELEEPYYCDEIQEEKQKGVHNLLLSLIEKGEARIDRGSQSIQTRFNNSMNWMSNPKYQDEVDTTEFKTKHMATAFTNALEKIMTNVYAFGSRVGLFIFTDTMESAKREKTVSLKETKRIQKKFITLREKTKKPFQDLFKEEQVIKWLESGHDKDYIKALREIKSGLSVLRDFKNGLNDNFRHSRGSALRLALVERIGDLLRDDLDLDELLELAEDKHKVIQDMTISSLHSLVDCSVSGSLHREWLRGESRRAKELIFSLLEANCEGGTIPLSNLESISGISPSRFKCVSSSTLAKYGVTKYKENDSVAGVFFVIPEGFEKRFGDYLNDLEKHMEEMENRKEND